jgi:repressor LexA
MRNSLSRRQQRVFDFIKKRMERDGVCPTTREIADHFRFRKKNMAASYVTILRQKKALATIPDPAGGKRALVGAWRLASPSDGLRKPVLNIPLLGSIPAGPPQKSWQEAQGCVSVDITTLGIKPTPRTYALRVKGDSMIGRHILDGDIVVVEHGQTPRNGDVVAALIDGESTLKTFVTEKGKPYLRAENPRYPKLIPAAELVVQGVMVAMIRKFK